MSGLPRFLLSALGLAWASLSRHLLRAFLTAFGILIGVAAVTIVVALGEGASRAVVGSIDALGENTLMVTPRDSHHSGALSDAAMALREGDAEALAREATSVRHVAPLLLSFAQVSWRDANESAQLIGTTRPFFDVRAWRLADGSVWRPSAEASGEKVCLVGATVQEELFQGSNPVGQTLRIGRHPFTVVGVLADKGQSPFGFDQNDVIVMPLATMRSKVKGTAQGIVDRILLSAAAPDASERAEREITAILRQRHGLAEGTENDFSVRSQEEFRKTQEQILGVLRMLLLSIAAVSLVVGGIGIMNIMLVSVTERTREIGIRMAIGAREVHILAEFLFEAVLLSLAGGAAGTLIAWVAISGIGRALEWQMEMSLQALAVALTTSVLVGVLFGILPARRAARMDPIEALARH